MPTNPTIIPKNPAAVSLGRAGGTARAAALTQAQRAEIAKLGAKQRWKGHVKQVKIVVDNA